MQNYMCPACKATWEIDLERESDFEGGPINPVVGRDTLSAVDATRSANFPACPNCGARGRLMTPDEYTVAETADLPAPDMRAALRDREEDLRKQGR